jgi:acid stress-induced BolA-like protein IbaG/YrbA
MLSPDTLRGYIAAGLDCEELAVSGDGHHFEARIVCRAFAGKQLIARHQMVYAVLGDRMREEIHALSMKTLTPEEAHNPGQPPNAGQSQTPGQPPTAGQAHPAGRP